MINAEDLRIGDIVQTNKDCMFPKDTLCIVTEIHPDRQHNDKKEVVTLKAANDEDDGPRKTWCCNIDGVPITPEILRNNDFKEEVEGKLFTRSIKGRAGKTIARYFAVEREKYAWAIFIKYYNLTDYALLCHVKYVHELQFALKIMKFNPKMKVYPYESKKQGTA
nr:MAG TPA: hypothetical protein [Caudoviricetes sp.]